MTHFLVDYHVHSRFSFDSGIPAATMVMAALKNNLSEICLTEHKDTDPFYEWTGFYQDEPYTRNVQFLKLEFEGQISVKKGVELDFQSETAFDCKNFVKSFDFDFVIASVHALKHKFVDADFFKKKDPMEAYHDYLKEVLSLSRFDFFDVVGHLDYIKRFGFEICPLFPGDFEDILREILVNLVQNRKGIEINTSGWRHVHGEPYPSAYILKMFKQLGGEIITIGSDAHKIEDVGGNIEMGISLLKSIGFDGIYVFNGRDPKKIPF